MKKLWLSYAWKDNEQSDVDFVAQEIEKVGIDVRIDRWSLIAGRRLWEQIGKNIESKTECDAWAIFATENSLDSEPCKEEIAIALDRALRVRGDNFPLIGIFPASIGSELIPPAIRTRLYVRLSDPDWLTRVKSAVDGSAPIVSRPQIAPFFSKLHSGSGVTIVEVRPRVGRWFPVIAAVPVAEKDKIGVIIPGPSGTPTGTGLTMKSEGTSPDGKYAFWVVNHAADPQNSIYVYCKSLPNELLCGPDKQVYSIPLR
nr:toll/interleukin-1 receptor domain-containing protein [uncultured Azospirillum sp.]